MINLTNISNKKLAAQLIFPRISAEIFFKDEKNNTEIKKLVETGVGGFCVFAGSVDDTYKMIEELQGMTEIPLLFCADFEHGLTMRLSEGTAFPRAMACGKQNSEKTREMAKIIAREARSIGIKWNLAPVCDVNSNRNNPIINVRAYGENVKVVEEHTIAYIEGTQSENVLACAKHFPGHGDTSVDSHLEIPVLNHDLNRLRELELKPFINAIKHGVKSIMPGHIAVTALDDSNLPASLSYKITTELLRNELGFDGLIVSDALDMKAISKKFTSGEAAIKAVNAGIDILLLPGNPFEAIEALSNEAEAVPVFRQKLLDSNKILQREKKWSKNNASGQDEDLNKIKASSASHEKLAIEIAFNAVDILGDKSLLPVEENKTVAAFAFIQGEDIDQPSAFFNLLAQAIENDCDFGFVDENIRDEELDSLLEATKNAEIIILAFFYRAMAYKGSANPSQKLTELVNKFSNTKKTIAVLLGNPYLKEDIKANTHILAYSDTLPSIAAAVMALSGRRI